MLPDGAAGNNCGSTSANNCKHPDSAYLSWGILLEPGSKCPNPESCRLSSSPCSYAGFINQPHILNAKITQGLAKHLSLPEDTTWAEALSLPLSDNEVEVVQQAAQRVICPYVQGKSQENIDPYVQCYLTREKFRDLQTNGLELYTGLYVYYDIFSDPKLPKLIYCILDPRSSVHFPFYTRSADGSWSLDPDVHFKQFVARSSARMRRVMTRRTFSTFLPTRAGQGSPRLNSV